MSDNSQPSARIGFIGCGFVADLYMRTLGRHPSLALAGVTDRNADRLRQFCDHYQVNAYPSVGDVLADERVDLVVNLTNPRSHYAINRAVLEAGKHLYSEKPLAMSFDEASELVELAQQRGIRISSAPCNVLGESAQAAWRALRDQQIGAVRLVYAELDDGMVPRAPYRRWFSESGAPWPFKDEFEVGCTLEHAGYYLTWLAAFFGPAESVTCFGAETVPDKAPGVELDSVAPDFAVAVIRFHSGVVARLTCSIVAPHDHRLRVMGDKGVLSVRDCWDFRSPVWIQPLHTVRRRLIVSPIRRRVRLPRSSGPGMRRWGAARMDFLRGISELADAIVEDRPSRLSPEFCLHVNELALAIHRSDEAPGLYAMRSTFEPIEPMPWAVGATCSADSRRA